MTPDETDDLYELAPEPKPPPARGHQTLADKLPVARPAAQPAHPVRPAPPHAPNPAELGAPRPLSYRSSRPSGDAPNPLDYRAPAPADDAERLRNQQLPVGILLAGLVIELVAAYLRSPTIRVAAVDVTLMLVARNVVLVAAVLIAARVGHIELGSFRTSILKLAATVVGAGALVTLLSPVLDALPYVPTIAGQRDPAGMAAGPCGVFRDAVRPDRRPLRS